MDKNILYTCPAGPPARTWLPQSSRCPMNEITPIRPNDLDPFWMPYSNNRAYKTAPRMLARAEGMYYYTPEGREILDGTAGLWCCNAGHGRREITEAIQHQASVMDFAPTFNMGHPIAFQAAAKVAELTPPGLDRVFFTNSGSEAADTALKIALAYHRARGEGQRVRLIGRERGYHGVGFGGISVGGIGTNRRQFGVQLPYVDHLPHTHSLAHNAYSKGQPEWGRAPRRRDGQHDRAARGGHHRGGDRGAAGRLDRRAGAAGGISAKAGGRSATRTASC